MGDALRHLMWIATYDDRWDTTQMRWAMRNWKRKNPKKFVRIFFKLYDAWDRKRRRRQGLPE
jgi:hypothetical protein